MRILALLLILTPQFIRAQEASKDSILYLFYGCRNDGTCCRYEFYNNGTVICDETGHLAVGYTKGSFLVNKDTVFITPLPQDQQTDKYYYRFTRKFFLDGDSSLVDLEIYYDYRRAKPG